MCTLVSSCVQFWDNADFCRRIFANGFGKVYCYGEKMLQSPQKPAENAKVGIKTESATFCHRIFAERNEDAETERN